MSLRVWILDIPISNLLSISLRTDVEERSGTIHRLTPFIHDFEPGFDGIVNFDPFQPRIAVNQSSSTNVHPGINGKKNGVKRQFYKPKRKRKGKM